MPKMRNKLSKKLMKNNELGKEMLFIFSKVNNIKDTRKRAINIFCKDFIPKYVRENLQISIAKKILTAIREYPNINKIGQLNDSKSPVLSAEARYTEIKKLEKSNETRVADLYL